MTYDEFMAKPDAERREIFEKMMIALDLDSTKRLNITTEQVRQDYERKRGLRPAPQDGEW